MIKLQNVCKNYYLGEEKVEALKKVTLEIKKGEYVGILGPSGSGKSTLMHMLGLLDLPTSGKIKLFGKDISKLNDDEISRLRNQHVGFVFQQFNLIEKFTVLENVVMPAQYAKKKLDFNPNKYARELLEKFGIEGRMDFNPNQISGGEQQRTAIARALIMKPEIILADEPTGNIDTKTGNEILDLLDQLNKEWGVTVIVVTHEREVSKRTKRQIYVKDGKIVKRL